MNRLRAFKAAEVIAFPPARRRDLVVKVAAQMAARPPHLADAHLRRQLERQGRVFRRKCVPDRNPSRQEARRIIENVTRCVSILAEFSRAEMRSPANDTQNRRAVA
jgi:hypothetical protein